MPAAKRNREVFVNECYHLGDRQTRCSSRPSTKFYMILDVAKTDAGKNALPSVADHVENFSADSGLLRDLHLKDLRYLPY